MAVAVLATSGFAQGMFGRQKAPGEEIAKLFGKNTAFTADAAITMTESAGKAVPAMQVAYAMLDGKLRIEMDMTKMGGSLPPEAVGQMKQMGMDRTVMIFVPEKNVQYMVYPGLKAYCEVTPGHTAAGGAGKEAKIEKTELGKETVGGHPCLKVKVTVTEENGRKFDSLMWQAADLKDFPIKTEIIAADGKVITILFSNINQSKPAATLFVPPSEYTKYGSMQEMMMGGMGRMMPPHGGDE